MRLQACAPLQYLLYTKLINLYEQNGKWSIGLHKGLQRTIPPGIVSVWIYLAQVGKHPSVGATAGLHNGCECTSLTLMTAMMRFKLQQDT